MAGASGLVPSVFLDGLGVDEGRAAGQRDAADARGCGGEGV